MDTPRHHPAVDPVGGVPKADDGPRAIGSSSPLSVSGVISEAEEKLKWLESIEHTAMACLVRDLLAVIRALQDERNEIAEELASNRACNRFTWKERAEAAEGSIRALQQEIGDNIVKHWADRLGKAANRE